MLSISLILSCFFCLALSQVNVLSKLGPNYSTFVRLANSSGFSATVQQQQENSTFFVPTNQAFGKLPSALMNILESGVLNDVAKAILQYHQVKGIILTSDIPLNGSIQAQTNLDSLVVNLRANQSIIGVNQTDSQTVMSNVTVDGNEIVTINQTSAEANQTIQIITNWWVNDAKIVAPNIMLDEYNVAQGIDTVLAPSFPYLGIGFGALMPIVGVANRFLPRGA
jgi:uncharacterized surface protein with fasciclin (FAS1) repeats